MNEKGWLQKEFDKVREEISKWPKWKQDQAEKMYRELKEEE